MTYDINLDASFFEIIKPRPYFAANLVNFFRTLNQFVEAKVVTNILSTTEDLSKAEFPKLVLKNKYNLR